MAEPLAEEVLQSAIQPSNLAYCPTMDLIALATVDENVHILRLNGQEVLKFADRHADGMTKAVIWNPDGCDTSICRLYYRPAESLINNARTGKVVHRIDCSEYSASPVCCAGWAINYIEQYRPGSELESLKLKFALGHGGGEGAGHDDMRITSNLPQQLASLAAETLLPKLSPLPSGGMNDDIFSSRVSLDTVFRPYTAEGGNFSNVLIIGFKDACVHLSIYDSFHIGVFSFRHAFEQSDVCYPVKHCFHTLSTTHSLLVHSSDPSGDTLSLLPLDLRLLSNAKKFLPILASKLTQMRYLLRYIQHAQVQLYGDVKTALDLPRRFIVSIEETLGESAEWNWKEAAYHLVVTGHCPPEVKDWLVNQVGEWGHKRWDKAVVMGFENARRLAHENILPALERFNVIISHLRGLSKFQLSNCHLGLSSRQLDNIVDSVSSLQLLTHQILITCRSELHQFQAFSSWMRQEIDKQASENFDGEKENNARLDIPNVLRYIDKAMIRSHLLTYLDLQQPGQRESDLDLEAHDGVLFELYKEAASKKVDDGTANRQLPSFGVLIHHLGLQCSRLFEGIADTQRRGVRLGRPLSLAQGSQNVVDMKMVARDDGQTRGLIQYILLGQKPSTFLDLYQIPLTIENGLSSYGTLLRARITFGNWELRDARFIDDNEALIAIVRPGTAKLLRVPFGEAAERMGTLEYAMTGRSKPHMAMDLSEADSMEQQTWLEFGEGPFSDPQSLEVSQREGKRVACVVSQDGRHYRVYDLDQPPRNVVTPDVMHE